MPETPLFLHCDEHDWQSCTFFAQSRTFFELNTISQIRTFFIAQSHSSFIPISGCKLLHNLSLPYIVFPSLRASSPPLQYFPHPFRIFPSFTTSSPPLKHLPLPYIIFPSLTVYSHSTKNTIHIALPKPTTMYHN